MEYTVELKPADEYMYAGCPECGRVFTLKKEHWPKRGCDHFSAYATTEPLTIPSEGIWSKIYPVVVEIGNPDL